MSQVLSTLSEACGGKGSKLNWALVLGGGWLFCMTFDVIWFLRLGYTKLHSLVSPKLALTDEGVIHSICAPTDIDFFCHMNNGRYLRELDFGRFDFYFRSGLAKYFRSHADIYVVQSAAMIRYRRSLGFLMPFRLHTRLVWFDDRALYFEQRFISTHDNFVRAIGLCKNTAVNCNVPEVMRDHFGHERPLRCPEWLRAFLEANECGSQQLKLEQEQNLNT